jgi:hypothetical protein
LHCTASDLEEFAVLLLQVGCRMEGRRPAELRDAFRAVARRALAVAEGVG